MLVRLTPKSAGYAELAAQHGETEEREERRRPAGSPQARRHAQGGVRGRPAKTPRRRGLLTHLPFASFEDAVYALNNLQSNEATIQRAAQHPSPAVLRSLRMPEHLAAAGVQVRPPAASRAGFV